MMESLRGGPINSFFFGEKMSSSECLEQAAAMGYHPQASFLQMLNGAATQSEEAGETEQEEEDKNQLHFQIQQRLYFQRLLEIQERYKRMSPIPKIEPFRPLLAADSCITHALPLPAGPTASAKERKKRKRTRAPPPTTRNPQEAESQRMNHIAVERNRRRLMNSHLASLRSLMPASFAQRGDQASIVAGAIDFVKELEQLLLSLQAKKRMRAGGGATATATSSSASSSSTNDDDACHVSPAVAAAAASAASGFFTSPQYTGYTGNRQGAHEGVDVEATVVQGHVNLKLVGRRRRGQLVRAVAAMEEIGLTVLHLNVTSLDDRSILYSLNLKIEEECKLGSADEIATAVHQIFSYISDCCHCQ